MTAYTEAMSTNEAAATHRTTHRTATHRTATPSADRPTATFPTGQWLAHLEAHRERLADLWEDATPTELLPVADPAADPAADPTEQADTPIASAFPAVAALPEGARPACHRTGSRCPAGSLRRPARGRRAARHLRSALTALALAAAILTGLQLYAAHGISDARQAALRSASARDTTQTEQATPPTGQSRPEQAPIHPTWVTEDTGAPYNRTDPSASPLSLPRCTTSPDTPLPCLATISPNSTRAVVLEEDASLTALVRR